MLTACASVPNGSDKYIRTTGTGNSFDEAKQKAFQQAIEIKVGSFIDSERQSFNQKLVRDDILVYSAGYVDDFKVVSQNALGNKVVVTVDVLVASSKLANRIISQGKSAGVFENRKHITQYQTFLQNRQNGDKLLDAVLNDYPQRAYNITQHPYYLKVDADRRPYLYIPYTISWNFNYIESFRAALDVLADGDTSFLAKSPGNVLIMMKDPNVSILGGTRTLHKFNDIIKMDKMADTIHHFRPVTIKLKIYNLQGAVEVEKCYIPRFIDHSVPPLYYADNYIARGPTIGIQIEGNRTETSNIVLPLNPQNGARAVEMIKNIEVSVVPRGECKNEPERLSR
jgi:hypothetical protein